jgi:hypothetical protein
MSDFALGIVVIFSASSVVAFIWLAINRKRQREAYIARAMEMGFEPLEEEDPVFLFRLAKLHKIFTIQRLEVRNLYWRQNRDYQLYLFDLVAITSDGPTSIQPGMLAVQSPLLHLPRFSIVPKFETGALMGYVGKLLYRMVRPILSQKRSPIGFEAYPEFEKRYDVAGEDEEAVRKVLSDQVLRRLSRERYWQIEVERDLFTFKKFEIDYFKKFRGEDNLKERVREAMFIFDLFQAR